MNIAIEKLAMIVIFLIVLVALFVLLFSGKIQIDFLLTGSKLRDCCQTYRANGCPDRAGAAIMCKDDEWFLDIVDESNLDPLGSSSHATLNQTKMFCGCKKKEP